MPYAASTSTLSFSAAASTKRRSVSRNRTGIGSRRTGPVDFGRAIAGSIRKYVREVRACTATLEMIQWHRGFSALLAGKPFVVLPDLGHRAGDEIRIREYDFVHVELTPRMAVFSIVAVERATDYAGALEALLRPRRVVIGIRLLRVDTCTTAESEPAAATSPPRRARSSTASTVESMRQPAAVRR